MKKFHALVGAAVLALGIGLCSYAAEAAGAPLITALPAAGTQQTDVVRGRVLGDYVIDLPLFTEVDEKAGLAADEKNFGRAGCSTVVKVMETGDTVVGHSMDSFYSHRAAYILRTKVPGRLETVGLAYQPHGGSNFVTVAQNGISKKEIWPLMYYTTDILNEKGLYVEFNMRPGEPEYYGIQKSRGTKPGATRVSIMGLVRYLGERAGTVAEALEIAKTLDVHGLFDGRIDWTGALTIADSAGNYGVLELIDNKLIWLDKRRVQTNYFLNETYQDKVLYGTGRGRYSLLKKEIPNVRNEVQLAALLTKVRFSNLLNPYTCPFDLRDEFTGDDSPGMHSFGMTAKEALAEENRDYVSKLSSQFATGVGMQTVSQRQSESVQWLSVFQVVANCNKKTMHVMFFENPQTTYEFAVGK